MPHVQGETMTLFQKVSVLWKVKGFVQDEYKEAKKVNESGTPGYKTTEFYLNLAGQVAVVWGAVQGFIPPKYAAVIYTVARTVAKAVSDIQAAKATSTTVTTTAPVTTVTTP